MWMQLEVNQMKKMSSVLASSAATLLGSGSVQAEWDVDTAVLFYTEKDRVSAVEPAISLKTELEDSTVLGVKFVLDSLTGASPNGATAATTPQTFSTPSGNGTYTTPAGQIPLDDTFKDTRGQLGATWDAPLVSGDRYTLGANFSTEYDYTSLAFSGGMTHFFNQKNTTLNWGVSLSQDLIKPVGGVPVGASLLGSPTPVQSPPKSGADESRTTIEALVGLTQVIDKRSVFQVNLGVAASSGYHTDPYKLVSLLDVQGEPTAYYAENRPDSRLKTTLYTEYRRHLERGDTLTASYRLSSDDWGVTSHTLEGQYRWNINEKWSLTPQVRYYQQSAADFYTHHLTAAPTATQELSADSRLADLTGITLGAQVTYRLKGDEEISLRLAQYEQKADGSVQGVPAGLPQTADLSATWVQLGYRFKF